jgi:RNA polymerase sigma-70 factor, ECF subfamily
VVRAALTSSANPDPVRVSFERTDFEGATLPYLDDVARFALSLTRDRADADDLVQETYLRAFHGWHTFQAGHDSRRWLFTICRNAFLRLRERRNNITMSDAADFDAMPAVQSHIRALHDGLAGVFELLDVRPAIERAIAALPEPHHSVLVLIDVEQLSYEECAAILDVPVGTVRSRLFRARRMIQEALLLYAEDAGLARKGTRATDAKAMA